jgi:hypothetical protein
MTRPNKTYNGSFGVEARITSFPLSSKGFALESSAISNNQRLDILNIALTLYLPSNSTL